MNHEGAKHTQEHKEKEEQKDANCRVSCLHETDELTIMEWCVKTRTKANKFTFQYL